MSNYNDEKVKELCERICKVSLKNYENHDRPALITADAPRISTIFDTLGRDALIKWLRNLCAEVSRYTNKPADEYTNKSAANMIRREFSQLTPAQLIAALLAFCDGETSKHFFREFDTQILHDAIAEYKKNYITPAERLTIAQQERAQRDGYSQNAVTFREFITTTGRQYAINAGINPDTLPDPVPHDIMKQIILAQPDENQ